jgi:hypothetical protein
MAEERAAAHPLPIPRRANSPSSEPPRVLLLREIVTLPGGRGDGADEIPLFDVATLAYAFAESYPNPSGGIERPPPGFKVLLLRVRTTNAGQVRGRPPPLTATHRGTSLRGCVISLGDREPYRVLRELAPDETTEGWLCHVVPQDAQAAEIEVSAGGRSRVIWRLG